MTCGFVLEETGSVPVIPEVTCADRVKLARLPDPRQSSADSAPPAPDATGSPALAAGLFEQYRSAPSPLRPRHDPPCRQQTPRSRSSGCTLHAKSASPGTGKEPKQLLSSQVKGASTSALTSSLISAKYRGQALLRDPLQGRQVAAGRWRSDGAVGRAHAARAPSPRLRALPSPARRPPMTEVALPK
jgi:hypothetical protein